MMLAQDVFDHVGDAICCLDRDWKVTALNPAATRFFGIDTRSIIGYAVWDRAPIEGNEALRNALRTVMSSRAPLHIDLYLPDRDRWADSRIFPLTEGGLGVSLRDITEQKNRETKLIEAVENQEILFSELTHGLTNIFQELASRLHLESRELDDSAAQAICQKLAAVVRSRSLVYRRLYPNNRSYDQDLGEYLKALCNDLASSLPDNITLSVQAELSTKVSIEVAATLGMIIVELVLNSEKHAWPPGQPGRIEMVMRRVGSTIQIEFSDNGRGLPEDIAALESEGLGLRLMNLQIKRLKGRLEGRPFRGGAGFTLTIPSPGAEVCALEPLA
jgi:PAS domain S-box-containing protein